MTGEISILLLGILISALAFINAFTFPGDTSDGVPGAGAFPQAICAIIIFINIILLINALRKKKKKVEISEEHKEGLIRIGFIAAATIVMLILWGKLHFIILCSIYMIVIGIILKQKMKTFIPGAIISSALIWFIFQRILNVMLNG
jgi:hypothetical protein